MGALADFIANQTVYDNSDQSDGIDRSIKRYFDELVAIQGDPAYPAGYDVTNAVHTIPQDTVDHTAGDFTLTVLLRNGETFTTAAIAHNATAGTIETAIDTAASGVTGWTNGDITVAGGVLQTADVTLTFDGTSVAGDNHTLTTMADSRTGGTSPSPTTVKTTPGQTAREVWAVMDFMNVTAGVLPIQGTASPMTIVGERGNMHLRPNADVLRALAAQVAIDDISAAAETALLDGLRDNGVAV